MFAKMTMMNSRKRIRSSNNQGEGSSCLNDPFDNLPDDMVITILSNLCHTVSCPSDFINALIVCKRFNRLGMNRLVLSRASSKLFSIRAKNWSDSSHRFVKQCVHAGSVEAYYFLGMIRFYCLENRSSGASLMAKAALGSHAPSLYSLALIQFNGSGGSKSDKDLRAGVALCARAAFLGHVDALRELGHCLQDGYGVHRNVQEGRRLLVQANARELASALTPEATSSSHHHNGMVSKWHSCIPQARKRRRRTLSQQEDGICSGLEVGCALLSDFGCNVPVKEPEPAHRFLVDWFESRSGLSDPGLRICSYSRCGRPETRAHEFRRCSVCGAVNYCSRGCQAHDWKLRHKGRCLPVEQWALNGEGDGAPIGGLMVEGAHDAMDES